MTRKGLGLLAGALFLASPLSAQWVAANRSWGAIVGDVHPRDYVTLPSVCRPFTLLIDSDADTTGALYLCGSDGVAKAAGGSAGDITAVTAGTGLTGGGTSGAVTLAVAYGTSAGTAAQGDDSRFPSGTNTGDQTKTCTAQFLRTLAAGTSSTCESVAIGADVSGLGTGVATGLASAATGSGGPVLADSPTLAAGTLADGESALTVTGTMPSSASTDNNHGVALSITSAGSAARVQNALTVTMGAGFTGGNHTFAGRFVNNAAGTYTEALIGFTAPAGNVGAWGHATAGTVRVGLRGDTSAGGSKHIGVLGYAVGANNIGVFGAGSQEATGTAARAGGYFVTTPPGSYFPTITTPVALVADNLADAADILDLRDNGTSKQTWEDGGSEARKGDNGSVMRRVTASELITLSTSGTTTDSSADLLPANSVIDGAACRVTTTITTATDWSVGDGTTAARFASANATMTAGTTSIGLNHRKGGVSTDATGPTQSAAAKLRITTTGTPGAGAVRCTVWATVFVAPTS